MVSCSDGTVRIDEEAQRLWWTHGVQTEGFVHEIRIRDMKVERPQGNIPWMSVVALVLVLLGMLVIRWGG